jgi:hypothetical protein
MVCSATSVFTFLSQVLIKPESTTASAPQAELHSTLHVALCHPQRPFSLHASETHPCKQLKRCRRHILPALSLTLAALCLRLSPALDTPLLLLLLRLPPQRLLVGGPIRRLPLLLLLAAAFPLCCVVIYSAPFYVPVIILAASTVCF